jgi:hypothetical protein
LDLSAFNRVHAKAVRWQDVNGAGLGSQHSTSCWSVFSKTDKGILLEL